MVLRRGADHRGAADVDVLDAVFVTGAFVDGRLERVEVDHQQVDRRDAVRLHRIGMLLVVADREQAAMHLGMQRLDPAVHHFGKAGEVGDVATLAARPRRSPSRCRRSRPVRRRVQPAPWRIRSGRSCRKRTTGRGLRGADGRSCAWSRVERPPGSMVLCGMKPPPERIWWKLKGIVMPKLVPEA